MPLVGIPLSRALSQFVAGPTVTFPAAERHCPLVGTDLYCLVVEASNMVLERLTQGRYVIVEVAFPGLIRQ